MRIIRAILLALFLLSVVTVIAVRTTGCTATAMENGKFYLCYRSQRFETTPEEFANARLRGRIVFAAAGAMIVSLALFIAIQSNLILATRRRR
jgi:hypothetical protein